MRLFLPLLIAATAAVPATAQTTQKLTATKANEYGLIYSLPTTELDITIQTTHTRRTPGEFYNYARRHLAINNAIKSETTEVEVTSVTITPHGTPDPENRWLVQFKNGTTPYMILTSDGIPLTLNTETPAPQVSVELPSSTKAEPSILDSDIAHQAMTEDMIRSSSISKRAELAAARVFELRDTRSELLGGRADNPPADGKAMQLVLDNIAGQEKALTAMFTGVEQTWTNVSTITVTPDSTGMKDEVIARISPYDGILDADDLSGAPLTLTVEVVDRGELPVTERGETRKFPKGGFAYQIPGTARVTVSYEGVELASQQVALAQLGVTFGLDPAMFTDKKAPAMLRLDPNTGGIVELGQAE